MKNIAKCLRQEYSRDELYLLLARRNVGSFTYDGIERGGERVCAEIEEELSIIESKGGKITKLSIIGYSLGGLVSRYLVGLLDAKGILDTVECMVRYSLLFIAATLQVADCSVELLHICIASSRCSHAPQRMAQQHLERRRRQIPLHVRPAALHH
jgi:hypothetical protein